MICFVCRLLENLTAINSLKQLGSYVVVRCDLDRYAIFKNTKYFQQLVFIHRRELKP